MMNKQLKLLRAQPANTNTSLPLENVTNFKQGLFGGKKNFQNDKAKPHF
jgi:hypothetical protein